MRIRLAIKVLMTAALGTACAAGVKKETSSSGSGGAGEKGGSAAHATSSASASSGIGGLATSSGSSGTGGAGTTLLFVHTNTTLYQMDPSSPQTAPTIVGDFDCIGKAGDSAMTDLAVNEAGELWGISQNNVYQLDVKGGAVHCAKTIPLKSSKGVAYYALTFAPVGVLDPNQEVLIAGNTAGELWEVDPNGNLSLRGNFGTVPTDDGHGHAYKNAGQLWELSGDLVFLANNGSPVGFATVRDCERPPSTQYCNTTDTLLEIDMTQLKSATTQSVTKSIRGQIVPKANGCPTGGQQGFGGIYGIAAWNDKVFGFSHAGDVLSIEDTDGAACLLQSNSSTRWSGAGVTTIAPIVPPPK